MSSKSTPPSTTSAGISVIRQALYFPLGLAALYLTFFLGLLTPIFQRHFIFLHAIQYPFFPAYDQPHKYGLAPFKTRNLTFSTSDGERIGAWHILPEIFYQSHLSINTHDHDQEQEQEQWDEEVYDRAMREYPTILYLHGNSMNRAAPFRIAAYSAMTSRMDVNVVAIDYRGFGDSTGVPSEQGLAIDAEAAYGWIRKKQRSSSQSIAVFGQSLGTGIATLVAEKLEQLGTPLKGVVLMAPYTDLKALVKDFKLAGLFPVLAPIGVIPFNNLILDKFLKTQLRTITTLPNLIQPSASHETSIVLLHAKDDPVIPVKHSRVLFETLLKHASHTTQPKVLKRTIAQSATIQRFNPPSSSSSSSSSFLYQNGEENKATVTLIETEFGGHDQLTEGALDLVRLALKLPSHLSA